MQPGILVIHHARNPIADPLTPEKVPEKRRIGIGVFNEQNIRQLHGLTPF
jgi:hypothetical protein